MLQPKHHLQSVFTGVAVALMVTSALGQTLDGVQWVSPPFGGNNLRKVTFLTPQIGWAIGDQGTIVRTTDGGTRWEYVPSGTTSDLYGITFISDQVGWIVGDNGTVLSTVTGGASWERRELSIINRVLDVAFFNSDAGMIIGDFGLILRTSDGGNAWSRMKRNEQVDYTHLVLNTKHDGLLCGRDGSVSAVSRFGQVLEARMEFDGEFRSAVTSSRGDQFLLLDRSGKCARTQDKRKWDELSLPDFEGRTYDSFACATAVDDRTYLVGDRDGTLYLTRDAGRTWSSRPSPVQKAWFNSLTVRDDSTLFGVGSDGVIVKVLLNQFSVLPVNSLSQHRIYKQFFVDEDQGYALSTEGHLLGSRDGGRTWSEGALSNAASAVGVRDIVSLDDQTVQVITGASLLATTNGGKKWTVKSVVAKVAPTVQGVTSTGELWFAGQGYLVIGNGKSGRDLAFISPDIEDSLLDASVTGMTVVRSLPFIEEIRSFLMLNSRKWVVSTSSGRLFLTKNAGADWTLSWIMRDASDLAVPFPEEVCLWLSMSGKAKVLSFVSDEYRTPLAQQALNAALRFADTNAVRQSPQNGNEEPSPALSLLPPISGVSVSRKGGTCIACGRGLALKSTDQGLHWEQMLLPTDEDVIGVDFIDRFDGYAWVRSGKMFLSQDGGKTWVVSRGVSAARCVNFSSPAIGWLGSPQGNLMRTTNGGNTWSPMALTGGMDAKDLCADAKGCLWIGFPHTLMKLTGTEGTSTVLSLPGTEEIAMLGSLSDSSVAFLTSRGTVGVLTAENREVKLIPARVPPASVLAIGGPDWRRPFVLTSSSTHYQWDPEHKVWHAVTIPVPGRLNTFLFLDHMNGCAAGESGHIAVTRDGGITWSRVPRVTAANLHALAYSPLRSVVWVAGEGGVIYASDADFKSWLPIKVPAADSWMGLQFQPPDLLYIYTKRGKTVKLQTTEVVIEE
jgi:photosystem II stability/assembly factor-like uncharacterized protein